MSECLAALNNSEHISLQVEGNRGGTSCPIIRCRIFMCANMLQAQYTRDMTSLNKTWTNYDKHMYIKAQFEKVRNERGGRILTGNENFGDFFFFIFF